jgi:phosphomannomutase
VGHDTRFLGRRFAMAVAYELASAGLDVSLTTGFCPTPVLAHHVWRNNFAAGIMLTASHNPPEYQGFKFIPHFGGPALPEDTDRLDEILAEISASGKGFEDFDESVMENVKLVDPKSSYFDHLFEVIDFEAILNSGMSIAYDPMFGCGQGFFDGALFEAGFLEDEIEVIHDGTDPLFGGFMPEPKEAFLGPLREELNWGFKLGFATDGDADRFAAIDAKGNYYSPNILLFILADHLIERRSATGPIARTVATTGLLDKVAAFHKRELIETPVGFKYISKALRDGGAMMGGEESGGFSSAGWVPEKDGIFACLMTLEALALSEFNELSELLDSLYKKYGKLVSERIDLHVSHEEKDNLMKKASKLTGPFIGMDIAKKITIDGVKFVMADGSSVLLRPSGTEPVVRCYLEAEDADKLKQFQKEVTKALGLDL